MIFDTTRSILFLAFLNILILKNDFSKTLGIHALVIDNFFEFPSLIGYRKKCTLKNGAHCVFVNVFFENRRWLSTFKFTTGLKDRFRTR
jgi:hypothetical protein